MSDPNDELFTKIMRKSQLQVPFSDFEERTMFLIKQETVVESSLSKYKKLATLFFILGTGFGFVITYFLSMPQNIIMGVPSSSILNICRALYVLLVLTQLNNLLALLFPKGVPYLVSKNSGN